MRLSVVQLRIADRDRAATRERILRLLDTVRTERLDWIVFPETTLTGFCNDASEACLEDGDMEFFQGIARKHRAFVTFGGVADGENLALTLDCEGKESCRYSKIHLFSPMGEDRVYRAGSGVVCFTVGSLRVTPLVCYDLRFPYLFWQSASGTDLFVVIANWPAARIHHWKTLLTARAIENQAYVAGVNRVGCSPRQTYGGQSLVVDPGGQCVLSCGMEEEIRIVDIQCGLVEETRKTFPVFRDRKAFPFG